MRYPYIILVLALTGCIDPITLEQDKEVKVLVVEGGITTEFGPHTIKLTRSAQYGDVFVGEIKNEIEAKIFVHDDLGNTTSLLENGRGVYSTPEVFRGKIGRKYTLIIITKDGTEYQSYPESIYRVPVIDTFSVEYLEFPVKKEFGGFEIISGVEVDVTYNDPSEVVNYYKWETRGTFKLVTRPDLSAPTMGEYSLPKTCCSMCYAHEKNSSIRISSDRFYNGNVYNTKVFFLEDDGARFFEKYIIKIDQLSISKGAYEFYELLNKQLSIKGNIFDPPPATIRGNIIGISNPDEDVVGYFTASDIQTKEYHIKGEDLPRVVPLPIIPHDCRDIRNGTTIKPDNW